MYDIRRMYSILSGVSFVGTNLSTHTGLRTADQSKCGELFEHTGSTPSATCEWVVNVISRGLIEDLDQASGKSVSHRIVDKCRVTTCVKSRK